MGAVLSDQGCITSRKRWGRSIVNYNDSGDK